MFPDKVTHLLESEKMSMWNEKFSRVVERSPSIKRCCSVLMPLFFQCRNAFVTLATCAFFWTKGDSEEGKDLASRLHTKRFALLDPHIVNDKH